MGIENLIVKGELQAMRIGYARVSTRDQNLEMQLDALNKAGCKRIFTDKLSGAQVERPGLKEALSHLREADTLVVWKLDRLGRSVKGLVDLVKRTGSPEGALPKHHRRRRPQDARRALLFFTLWPA
jgi:predicted site-specific integrase-resolvase